MKKGMLIKTLLKLLVGLVMFGALVVFFEKLNAENVKIPAPFIKEGK